jgi:hypothetical protein
MDHNMSADLDKQVYTDDGNTLFALLLVYGVPKLSAEQIGSLFEVEEKLKSSLQSWILSSFGLDALNVYEDVVSREARLRAGIKEIQHLELLRTSSEQVHILSELRGVWFSLRVLLKKRNKVAVGHTIVAISRLRQAQADVLKALPPTEVGVPQARPGIID